MNEIHKYYKNTKNALPLENIKKFLEIDILPGNAIELGCGAGRDTIYLIKNGWNVLAIDREDTKSLIEEKLNENELKKFRSSVQNFQNVKLEKNNLIVSNYSIPFCGKKYFKEFWSKIEESIEKDGYFVGNFFGIKDSWVEIKPKMVFLSKTEVLELFKDFDIIHFKEIEEDKKTALGVMKHWHIYDIIAKKKL